MLQAMIDGEDDATVLAGLAHSNVKASAEELREALTGRFSDHHRFLAKVHLDLIDSYTAQISVVADRIEACFTEGNDPGAGDLAVKRALLTTIPGVSILTAERILAEIGADMSMFPTAAHLTSWAGIAPGANESAGKVKSSRCRPGNTYLKGTLGIAALSASRTKNTFLSARYKRIASRRGHQRALVAVQRTILTSVWHILTTGQPYTELGGDYYAKRRPGAVISKALQQLRTAGLTITFTGPTQAVVT